MVIILGLDVEPTGYTHTPAPEKKRIGRMSYRCRLLFSVPGSSGGTGECITLGLVDLDGITVKCRDRRRVRWPV